MKGEWMALRKADRDLPALTVLALLLTGPRHTYEMHRLMIDTRKDFVTGLPRSMYHAVERLLRGELIAVTGVDRDAGRPERTHYGLTDGGRAELRARLRRLLETPDPDSTLFTAALSFAGCLPTREVAVALRIRRDALARSAASARDAVATTPVPRVLLIEAEFGAARLGAERDWVDALLADLGSGALTWPDDLHDLVRQLPPHQGDHHA